MRVKNKEIRRRRHRKEQKIKDAAREIRAKYADKPVAAPAAHAAKKPAAPKKSTKKESA
jgi:hypothetical protein